MNSINIVAPYKHLGMWVFDDARVGLVQEPFIAGADTMLDRITANIPDAGTFIQPERTPMATASRRAAVLNMTCSIVPPG
jgi:hypothetical protein